MRFEISIKKSIKIYNYKSDINRYVLELKIRELVNKVKFCCVANF